MAMPAEKDAAEAFSPIIRKMTMAGRPTSGNEPNLLMPFVNLLKDFMDSSFGETE